VPVQNKITYSEDHHESFKLFDLANSTWEECKNAGLLLDLDTSISLFGEALDLRPEGHSLRSDSLKNLAAALVTRFSITRQNQDFHRIIGLLCDLVRGLPHPSTAAGYESLLDVGAQLPAYANHMLSDSIVTFHFRNQRNVCYGMG
jgi:hypothetical protein